MRIKHNNSFVTNPLEIANIFNSYFASVGSDLTAKIDPVETQSFDLHSDASMYLYPTNVEEVSNYRI